MCLDNRTTIKKDFKMLINEQIIYAYLAGELSPIQNKAIEDWEKLSTENKEKFRLVAQVYFAQEQSVKIDSKKAYKKLTQKIKTEKAVVKHKYSYLYWVASIAIILASIGLYSMLQPVKEIDQPTILYSEAARNFQVTLPDSSIIYLNRETKITIPSNFSRTNRKIDLEGEAFFDITSDSANPFIVKTPNKLNIQVYGTRFNVQAYPNDTLLTAKLYSGKIKVQLENDPNKLIELLPQEAIRYNYSKNSIQKDFFNDLEEDIGWRMNSILFNNANMDEVARSLATFYQVNIDISELNNINTSINGEFEDKELNTVLDYIKTVSGIDYKIEESQNRTSIKFYNKQKTQD